LEVLRVSLKPLPLLWMALELVGVRVLWLMGTGILDEDGVLDLYELVGTGMLDEEGVRDLRGVAAAEELLL